MSEWLAAPKCAGIYGIAKVNGLGEYKYCAGGRLGRWQCVSSFNP